MDCEKAHHLLSARLDGELVAVDAADLDAHLADCADCRATGAVLAAQHAQLARAFAPRRRAAAEAGDRVAMRLRMSSRRFSWRSGLLMLASAAAGFLVALVVLRALWAHPAEVRIVERIVPATVPVLTTRPAETQPAAVPSIGRLALATGAIEMCPEGAESWHAMETGGPVPAGARVRTGESVRCEFHMGDGSEVRLNERTELRFAGSRKLELADGQVWSGVAKAQGAFTVSVPQATVTALGTQFDLLYRGGGATLTVIEGTTRVNADAGGGAERVVQSGQMIQIKGGRLGELDRAYDLLLSTRWVNEILVLKGRDNPELTRRVDDLMAQIGDAKMSEMFESEIRSLGDHCVVPLTRYVQSDRSRNREDRRRTAAEIVSDVAQPWCIPYLIELLADRDADVRAAAAGGLQRLTHHTMGRSIAGWRGGSWRDCQETTHQWQAWWAENRDRFPGASDAPAVRPWEPKKKA